MPPRFAARRTATVAALVTLLAAPAHAQVFGSLANFDAVNDTGHTSHGFEIKIEDSSFHKSSIYSVFGLDRNFGVPPQSVVRYGAPTITEIPGVGVTVRYQASFANGAWSVGTPTGPYANAGDSCWPLGNALYNTGTLTCDHFGIATYGTPAKVSYSWLVDPTNSGTLTPVEASIPVVNFAYVPPAPGPAAPPRRVQVEIEAPGHGGGGPEDEVFGTPYWVKIFKQHNDHEVKLEDLMKGHPDVPDDQEVEIEWEIFQSGDKNGNKLLGIDLAADDRNVVLRYDFYRYQGELSADGEAICGKQNRGGDGATPEACGGLGAYVGAQMAGFNAVQPPLAPPVPEPAGWALMLGGLGLAGWLRRRRG